MALIPTFKVNITNSCSLVEFSDTTGRYDASNNVGGWGSPNFEYSDIATADIKTYDYLGTTLLSTYVTQDTVSIDQYPTSSPYPQVITFDSAAWANVDGVYQFNYSITDSLAVTISTGLVPKLICCNLHECIKKQELKLLKECTEEVRKKILHRVDELRMILIGIQSTFQCGNFADAQSAIVDANALCTLYDNCGC